MACLVSIITTLLVKVGVKDSKLVMDIFAWVKVFLVIFMTVGRQTIWHLLFQQNLGLLGFFEVVFHRSSGIWDLDAGFSFTLFPGRFKKW